MPVIATSAPRRLLTIERLRLAMRDLPGEIPGTGQVNKLLDGVEFSDEEIENAKVFVVSAYNCTTPISSLGEDQIELFILYTGVLGFLLRAEAARQIRNQIAVPQDSGPTGIDDKHGAYANFAEAMWQRFDALTKAYKVQKNMESVYRSISSGYSGPWLGR